MGTLTEFYTDAPFSEYSRNVPIEETYKKTVDSLEKATDNLNKCSRGILNLHLIPESSRPEFGEARTKLTDLAQIYTSLHFPLAVSVVRDVGDTFNLYAGYDDIKKLKKKTLKAMEKTISEQSTNSADSSLVHGLLLTNLEQLKMEMGGTSETLKREAEKMHETCEKLRQEIVEKNVQYASDYNDYIARRERHRKEKVQHNEETSQAAASVVRHSEEVRVHDEEVQEAREKKENAARQGTYGTVAGALGAVTMTGGYCGTVISAVGATALTGGLLVGGAAILGAGALLLTTAKVGERTAEGDERVAIVESSRARDSRERATEERDRARKLAEETDEKMRRAAQDADEVEARNTREISGLHIEATRAEQGAKDCDITVQSLSSVVDPLKQFVEAMETLSQFLSGLARDIDKCLGQVKAGRQNGKQRMNHHFALMQSYIGRVQSRCDNFENFQVVVQGRIDALPPPLRAQDAPASNVNWIQVHQDQKKLTLPQSQRIRVRLHLPSPSQWYHIPAIGCFRRSIAHS